jgi:type IV secretory pathway protease TraF
VLLVWNTTASVPVGFYVVTQAMPRRGDLLVVQLPPAVEALATSLGMLPPNAPLLKPAAALAGDRVCRFSAVVTINGHLAAVARPLDRHGRALPAWHGCRRI